MNIELISNKNIDKIKWDNCIANATNSLIYAYSFYLDTMAVNWDGIVIEDYLAVIPLPKKKKWGIYYYYTPPFIQQLGLFTKLDFEVTIEMILLLQKKVFYGDLQFNFSNILPVSFVTKINFILNLNQPFSLFENNINENLKKILKKVKNNNLTYSYKQEIDKAIDFYQDNYSYRHKNIVKSDYKNLKNLCVILLNRKMVFTRAIYSDANELLAIGLFLFDGKRIYNILNASSKNGKKLSSNQLLLFNVIKEFSQQDLIFDFEGSDIEGIKSVYKKYNPINQPYFFYHYNNLPKIIKWIKK